MMPLFSADKPASTFSILGGCVHTMEKPKPCSGDLVSFLVMVKGVRPLLLLFSDDCRDWLSVTGGSSSRKRRNRFSSASAWCWAILLNATLFSPVAPSLLLLLLTFATSSVSEFPNIVLTMIHSLGWRVPDRLCLLALCVLYWNFIDPSFSRWASTRFVCTSWKQLTDDDNRNFFPSSSRRKDEKNCFCISLRCD